MMEKRNKDRFIKLSDESLKDVPPDIVKPIYNRSQLTGGIVHIGLGNFHRAHQAWYLHRLMQQGQAHDWAIIGAGVKEFDKGQRLKLLAQDFLTTLVELSPEGPAVEIVGSMINYIPIEADNGALIAQMAKQEIKIVALTITEGGYYIDPVSKIFDSSHPDIVYDAAHPEAPKTAFGAIVAALRLRRDGGEGPFTCQSCDNLQGNGAILRQVIVALAELSDPKLSEWIAANCSFPNSMVDCIVPTTTAKERALVHDLGISDAVPVTHEDFRQWVIEDDFCAGRPNWDLAGATFTNNVHDFEMMKIRILNGGHQVVAVPGEILSVETIEQCMKHPLLDPLFQKVVMREVAPHVKAVPGITPENYVDLVHKRFSNPKIIDTTRRVAFDGSSRHSGFLMPSIRDGLANGTPVDGLALIQASWARMCEGTREDGTLIAPNDPFWDELQAKAKAARSNPSLWLEMDQIYGNLAREPQFAKSFRFWFDVIWNQGLDKAIKIYLEF
jgi:mannitol 2-dehydrogenase